MGSITSTSRPAQRWQMPWQMPLLSHRRIHLTHCSRGVAFVWILVVGVAGSWRCVWSRRWAKGISIRLELLEVGLVSRYSPRPRRRSVELEEVVGVAVAAANDAPTRHCDRQSGCPQSKRRSSDWDALAPRGWLYRRLCVPPLLIGHPQISDACNHRLESQNRNRSPRVHRASSES